MIYLPRTQMTLVLVGKGLVLENYINFKNRGHLDSRYIHEWLMFDAK